MRRLPRLFLLVFLVAFAAGSVVGVASSAAMALDMAAVNDTGMKMDGCAACHPTDMKQASAKCDLDCTTAAAAILFDATAQAAPPEAASLPSDDLALAGRTGPPDRAPPRTNFLI